MRMGKERREQSFFASRLLLSKKDENRRRRRTEDETDIRVQEEKDFHALLQVKYFVNKFFFLLFLFVLFTSFLPHSKCTVPDQIS